MGFNDVIGRTRRENRLFSALLELTYRCNLDCFFCYNDTSLKGKSLSLEQYYDLFDDLRSLGVFSLTLSGGEPLAHRDFFRLGARARERGFAVRIKSNGHALHGAMARRIRDEIDPFAIDISLHGATAETHDRQTRVKGSFDRLMTNLDGLRDAGLRLKLNSPLTRWNEHEIEAMMAIAEKLQLPLQFDTTITPRDNGDTEPLSIAPTTAGIQSMFRAQKARSRSEGVTDSKDSQAEASQPHCGAGVSSIAVDPYGTVYPCVQWRRAIGNLHSERITDIWAGNRILDGIRRENVEAAKSVARLGGDSAAAEFCPGIAHGRFGRTTQIYPEARLRLELWSKAVGLKTDISGNPRGGPLRAPASAVGE